MYKVLNCLINGCNLCYPETGTHYDSKVEVSEEEDEQEDESHGSKFASELDSEYSSDKN